MHVTREARFELAELIEHEREEIVRRWLTRVLADVANLPGMELTQLRDGIGDYISAIARTLKEGGGPTLGLRSTAAWSEVAKGHAITRVRIGFDVRQLVHEFIVLRQVIRDFAENRGAGRQALELIADIIDFAIAVAVGTYVDARDYDVRRRQALHIGFMTHELRNPLATAMLAAQSLGREASGESQRSLEKLYRSHERLKGLIDGVLLTEKLEGGKTKAQPMPIKLGELIPDAIAAAMETSRRKGVEFRASYDPELQVHADPELTRSILENLVDNAAKFTDEGAIELSVEEREKDVVFHVRDSCQGIAPEELRIIFEPFERGHTQKVGTGLGLAIARRAAELQGGEIGAESPGPSGCHFWVSIPRGPAEPTLH